jgi:hypothetical protein
MNFKLLRPTTNTLFHIDWSWFERNGLDVQSLIRNQLSPNLLRKFADGHSPEEVDYIDPTTGEVFRLDSLRETILAESRWEPDYINNSLPLMQGVFRVFLAENNLPLSPVDLAHHLGRRDPETILRVLTASGVQNGVVPLRK